MTETELFIQLIINGVTIGSYLALIALGYTMVYGIIQLINFAHGDVYMLGFLISLTFLGFLDVNRTLGGWQLWGITFGVMFVTVLCTGTINMLIDRIGYKPLRRAPRLAALITAVGVVVMLEDLGMIWKGSG